MWRPVRFVKIIPELSRKKRHRLRLESGVCLSWLRLSSCWQPSELQGLDHCLFISPPRSAADPCSHILLSRTLTSARNCRNQEMMNNCQPLKEFLASSSTAVRGYHWYMLGNFSMFYTEHLPTLSCPQGFLRSWLIDFLTQTKKKKILCLIEEALYVRIQIKKKSRRIQGWIGHLLKWKTISKMHSSQTSSHG